MTKRLHIVPNKSENVWKIKGEKADRAIKNFPTKQDALKAGTTIAKNQQAELIIHKKNGQIQNSNSFGNDPNPPKDKK